MSFEECHSKAVKWCEENSQLKASPNESEKKIILSCGEISVDLFMPSSSSSNFEIWSENENVQPRLSDVSDRLSSSKFQSIEDALGLINKQIFEPSKSAANKLDEPSDDDDDDEEDESDDYGAIDYDEPDYDAMTLEVTPPAASADVQDMAKNYASQGSQNAVHRLLKDMKGLHKATTIGVTGSPREDNLFLWDVKLIDIPPDTKLGQDIKNYAKKYKREECVSLEMTFPNNYPFEPPYVRIVRPRFKFLTGHVTLGGSICMELLTRSGWRPTNDIEGVLVQIRAEILSDPNARLDENPNRDYDLAESKLAFERMVKRYGWE